MCTDRLAKWAIVPLPFAAMKPHGIDMAMPEDPPGSDGA